jgi:hypothetical protein
MMKKQKPVFQVTNYYHQDAWYDHSGLEIRFTDPVQNMDCTVKDGAEPTSKFSNIPVQHGIMDHNPDETTENRSIRESLDSYAAMLIQGMGYVAPWDKEGWYPRPNLKPLEIGSTERLYARHKDGHLVQMDAYLVRLEDGFRIYNLIKIGD